MLPTLPQDAANDNHVGGGETMRWLVQAFEAIVAERVGADVSFATFEEATLSVGNEAMRQALQGALERIAAGLGDGDVLIDGEPYRPISIGTAAYHSFVGPLHLARANYRKLGTHNGPTAVALDLAAGMVEGLTPAFAERVAMGNGDGNSRELHRQLLCSRRIPPSRTVLHKAGTRIGEALHQETKWVEAACRRAEKLPEGTATICVGLDRTAVPMEEELPEGTPPKPRDKPRVRKAPKPVEVNHRMAYVGTVAMVDAHGDMLRVRKYAATPDDGPAQTLHSMMQDIRRALRDNPRLRVLVVQDAAKEMWNLVTDALSVEPSVETWDELVDHPHAMSHLWTAAEAITEDTDELMASWRAALRRDDEAIEAIHQRIRHELAALPEDTWWTPTLHKLLADEDTYLTNNKHRLRYASLRDDGCPIGSGATEGACKSFVSQRCKRSGQRWRNTGLQAALACRTHLLNDRLSRAMTILRRARYAAEVRPAA